MKRNLALNNFRSYAMFTIFTALFLLTTQNIHAATRTWDGGGATNNWSTAANWSADTIPTSADDVVFDATNTKNAVIDVAFTVNSVSMNNGYAGTISQNSVLTVINAFTQSAGTFQGTAANANFGTLILNAGSNFIAPSGTLSVTSQTAYEVFNFNGGTFNANGGTFSVDGRNDLNYFRYQTPAFNNLVVNKPLTILNASIIVNGLLTLNAILSNSQITVNGDVTFANGYTSGSAVLNFVGTATRTATLSGTTIGNPILINNPNLTLTTSATSGDVVWNQKVTIQAGTLRQSTANYTFSASGNFNAPGFEVNGGTFNGSAGNAVFNTTIGISSGNLNAGSGNFGTNVTTCPAFPQANYYFQQSGGSFNGNSSNAKFCDLRRTGGSFVAPSGTMTILNYGDLAGGTFSANNGTLIVENNVSINASGFTLNNVTFSGANGHGFSGTPKPQINGTLNLAEGQFSSGDVAANGDVIYGANFTGGGGRLFLEGTATRTINLPARNILLGMTLDNPNITVASNAGASTFVSDVEVKRGLFQQGNAVLTLNSSLKVSGGTFQGSASALNLPGLIVSGGTFSGGAGIISGGFGASINQTGGVFSTVGDVEVTSFTQSGGTFNAPSGTMTVVADWTHTAGGTFNGGTGTVKFTGYNTFNCQNFIFIDVAVTETFNNLTLANSFCNLRFLGTDDTLIVNGDLRLSAAAFNRGKIRANGTTTIDASNNGYSGSTIIEYANPNTNFVINNPSSVVNMLAVEMKAANSTLTSSGAGRINFVGMTLTDGTVNQGAGVWDITNPGYSQSGGIFNGSAAALNISNGAGNPIITGGVFNGGAGKITGGFRVAGGTMSIAGDLDTVGFSLEGGTFNAPLGVMSIGQGFSHTLGGIFNARTGTVQTSTAAGTFQAGFDINSTEIFNNLKFNGTNNNANHGIGTGDTLIVNGTLTFNGRGVNGGSIVANGDVKYTDYGAYQNATTIVKFQDSVTRSVTLCDGVNCNGTYTPDVQPTLINNPNITVNTGLSAGGSMNFAGLIVQQGTFNQNAGRIGIGSFEQSGGVYNAGTYIGVFNLPTTGFAGNFTLSGGDFNAGNYTQFFGNYTHTAGGNFNSGNGTVNFTATGGVYEGTIDVNQTENFNNVDFSPANGLYRRAITAGDTVVANGNLAFGGTGSVNGGTLEAKKNVVVNGGFGGGTTALTFSGATDQTFTNNGGTTTSGVWTINKPNSSGFADKSENNSAIAAPSTLFLNGNVGNSNTGGNLPLNYPNMNIVSGFVEQGNGVNISLGSFSSASGTSFTNVNDGDLILAGNLTNNGFMNINGGGSPCPQPDSILFRSSVAGTQRNWNGNGTFRITDVDVQDQAGNALITAYNSTNTGNNGANWSFTGSCATTAASVVIGGKVTNAKGRGIANVRITLNSNDGAVRQTVTNAFGVYRFVEVRAGETYIVEAKAKRFQFSDSTQSVSVTEDLNNVNFTALQ